MEEDKLLEAGRLEAAEVGGSHIGHLPTEKKNTLCKIASSNISLPSGKDNIKLVV